MVAFFKIVLSLLILLTVPGCGWLGLGGDVDVTDQKLSYWHKLSRRSTDELNMVVIHATELTDLAEAREYGERILYENSGTGASGHYYIDRDGGIYQYVPDDRIAHHTSGWNAKTLSVELINSGRYPNWYHSDHQVMQEPYPDAQIEALILLVNELKSRYPGIKYTEGHEDLDMRMVPAENNPDLEVPRKMDPGPHFPWDRFLAAVDLKKETPPGDYVFRNYIRPVYNKNLSQSEFANLQESQDITLLDVRLTEDFDADPVLIPGAEHKDPEMIASWADLLPKNKKIVLYCVKGAWVSHKAATYLNEKGYDVSTLNGGIRDWKELNR